MKTFHGERLPHGYIRLWATDETAAEVDWPELPPPDSRARPCLDWGEPSQATERLAIALLAGAGASAVRVSHLSRTFARTILAPLSASSWSMTAEEITTWVMDDPRAKARWQQFRDSTRVVYHM